MGHHRIGNICLDCVSDRHPAPLIVSFRAYKRTVPVSYERRELVVRIRDPKSAGAVAPAVFQLRIVNFVVSG